AMGEVDASRAQHHGEVVGRKPAWLVAAREHAVDHRPDRALREAVELEHDAPGSPAPAPVALGGRESEGGVLGGEIRGHAPARPPVPGSAGAPRDERKTARTGSPAGTVAAPRAMAVATSSGAVTIGGTYITTRASTDGSAPTAATACAYCSGVADARRSIGLP